jgi:hypothetical protein
MRSYYASGGTVPPPDSLGDTPWIPPGAPAPPQVSPAETGGAPVKTTTLGSKNDAVPEAPCPPPDEFSPHASVAVAATITLTGFADLGVVVRY